MAGEGVTTHLQKDVTVLQQEVQNIQREFSQLDVKFDAKLETRLQRFKYEFKGEIISELHNLRWLSPKRPLEVHQPPVVIGNIILQPQKKGYRWGCSRFDGFDFRA
ncbi:hypothetical protein PVK06_002516 [Gossypium arboreum]|uniref:Uncharacterized protein n=1 Tax=Gossypium arboreum TaxID=29729 RepID=A0ABR0R3Y2_GOSAR|nr:hypothetical protein PVK06_002516 [Gossypium arboreum]